jgi:hypothetical protein
MKAFLASMAAAALIATPAFAQMSNSMSTSGSKSTKTMAPKASKSTAKEAKEEGESTATEAKEHKMARHHMAKHHMMKHHGKMMHKTSGKKMKKSTDTSTTKS